MRSLSVPVRKALLAQDMSSPIQNAGGGSNPVRRLSLCRIISNITLPADLVISMLNYSILSDGSSTEYEQFRQYRAKIL